MTLTDAQALGQLGPAALLAVAVVVLWRQNVAERAASAAERIACSAAIARARAEHLADLRPTQTMSRNLVAVAEAVERLAEAEKRRLR